MSATKGNQFWKLRAKHGRDKIFTTPEILWECATDYFQWVDDNPFYISEAKVVSSGKGEGSEVQIVEIPKKIPYTMQGLCIYLGVNTKYFNDFTDMLSKNESLFNEKDNQLNKDFSEIITRIKEVIYNQKFSGASANIFNANIIAKDLGLIDKKEITQTTTQILSNDPLNADTNDNGTSED